MAGDKTNPSLVGGANEYSALRINLTRPDASTVGPGGNQVDRARINRTVTSVDKGNLSQPHPLGEPQNGGQMLTRKGRLRCDACGKKQPKRGEFMTLQRWDLGTSATFDVVEDMNVAESDHFCSWRCLAHHAISEAISDITPADVIGDQPAIRAIKVSIFHELTGPLYPVLDWPMNSGPNGGYNFCSGVLGLGLLGTFWHRHNCHEDGCWRPVRHGKTLCKRHEHPVPPAP